jgi:hypothetical protein
MRTLKMLGLTAVAALALTAFVGVSSAFAVQWNPQGTVEPTSLKAGTSVQMKTNRGATVTCNTSNGFTLSPIGGNPAVSGTTDSAGNPAPPSFSNCTSSLGSATVTASGQWLFTATSTTNVNESNASATVKVAGGICTITMTNVSIPNNTWSNSAHTLTSNSSATFPIHESGFCDGGTSATVTGVSQSPSAVTISP